MMAAALSGPRATADSVTGTIVAGGGRSSASGATVIGAVQITGAVSAQDGRVRFDNGSLSICYFSRARLRASYDGRPVDTVSHSDNMLKVSCDNAGELLDGRFLFRPGGCRQYDTLPMVRQTGDTLACRLPENILTSRGLEYYFSIYNTIDYVSIGSHLQPHAMVVGGADREFLCPDSLPDLRYQIIGVPLNIIGDSSPENILQNDLGRYDPTRWRLGRYDAACGRVLEFPDVPDVAPGLGFWLIAREGGNFGVSGYSVQPNITWNGTQYYRLAVDSGWNQLANPFAFDISYRELLFVHNGTVLSHDPEIIDDIAYAYNGQGFIAKDILLAWEGFFLFVKKQNVTVLFPYQEALAEIETPVTAKTTNPSPLADDWQLKLTLAVGELIDADNIFGVRADATDQVDFCDYREPPPPPNGPYLAFQPPDVANGLFRCDFREPSHDSYAYPIVMFALQDRSLTIEGVDFLPEDWKLRLCMPDKQPVLISSDTTLMLPDSVIRARLVVGQSNDHTALEPLMPHRFHLFQNHPNPFNSSTTIRFALPNAGRVRIDVYNILGRKVATVLDAPCEAGYHEYQWNACDSRGRALSSGLYLLRLESKDWRGYIKMLLLK